jgi:hypothetical protein
MAVAFVQAKTAASSTVTLDNPTTLGNCLAVLVSTAKSSGTPTVSAVKLGGAADNFAASGVAASNPTTPDNTAAWLDLNCAGGQTVVTVTPSSGASVGAVTVIEFSGVVTSSALDKSSTGHVDSGTTSFSSGTTATTSQADEVLVGAVTAQTNSTPTVTGPSSPWVNETSVAFNIGTGERFTHKAGYQIQSSAGTATYSGTISPSSAYSAIVITLKGASLSPDTGTGSVRLPKPGLAGAGSTTSPGSGSAAMAPMTASAEGDMLPVGTGVAALPAMQASGADTGALTPFSDLVLHIPGQDAPASLTPFVPVGGGADPPDGREYTVPSLLDGVFARFGGTYRFLLISNSWASPSSSRTVTVTVHQHEYTGGPSATAAVSRVLNPTADASTIPNGYVDMGSLTLPIRAIPDQNVTAYFTVSVTSTQSGDRFLDCLFLDVQGTTVVINTPSDYSTFFVLEPDANVQMGQVLGSAFDLPAATSVLAYAKVSGGPMSLRPGDNAFMAYSTKGAPALSLTYWPRFYQDALS